MELDLVVELADLALVLGQQPNQELLGAFLQKIECDGHAAARIEHHDGRDRRGLFSKTLIVCELPVVEHLEIVLHEIGDEPLLQIRDRHVHRARTRWPP